MAYEIVIPRLGWSMEEGTFVTWLKNDGDYVKAGQPLFELEGEKASQEIEAVDEGILRIPAGGPTHGAVLKVGAVIGYLVAEGEPLPSGNAQPQPATQAVLPGPSAVTSSALPPVAAPSVRRLARELDVALSQVEGTGRGGRILPADVHRAKSSGTYAADAAPPTLSPGSTPAREPVASPRARRVASELGLDWRQLTGSGASGRIRECDVRAAASAAAGETLATTESAGGTRIPLTSRRRTIAQRLVASRQQTVPVTLTTRADATNLVNLRQQFQSVGGSALVPSYQDIIVKLVAAVLQRHPLLAGRWAEDAIVIPAEGELHVGIAVDTDEGLLVPVIRNVAGLTLSDVARHSRELIERARGGKLTAADMQGGVFTITNLGAFGIDVFTPVINSPEAAILGLGAIRREPLLLDNGRVVAQQQLSLSLTFDHRILDGAPAARFLQDVVVAIANPSAWLLG